MEEQFRKANPTIPFILFGVGGLLLKLFGTNQAADVIGTVFLFVFVCLFVLWLIITYRARGLS